MAFAFIDLCRKRYDAVVMNPPFGNSTDSRKAAAYLKSRYPGYAKNIACAFLLRALNHGVPGFTIGSVSDRSVFIRKNYKPTREILLEESEILYADLGWQVLDDANVEVAAIACRASALRDSMFVDLRAYPEKEEPLALACAHNRFFNRENRDLESFPNSCFAYWVPKDAWRTLQDNAMHE